MLTNQFLSLKKTSINSKNTRLQMYFSIEKSIRKQQKQLFADVFLTQKKYPQTAILIICRLIYL